MALGYKYLMGHGVPKKCENAVQAYQRAAYEVQPTPQDLPICLSMYLSLHIFTMPNTLRLRMYCFLCRWNLSAFRYLLPSSSLGK